ncbi:MAG: FmdB family transcriptional regulator [Verrucomicrobiota bacterium]
MPIYEYYCPDNHTIYQFFAKTLAQGQSTPRCPANPKFRMKKVVSAFAITSGGGGKNETADAPVSADASDPMQDARTEAAMNAMETEFANVDENNPKEMGRMMRRLSELAGEKIDGEMEEVVRKLEEGTDPDSLEEHFKADDGDGADESMGGMDGMAGMGSEGVEGAAGPKESKHRFRVKRAAPRRDPQLYDYE